MHGRREHPGDQARGPGRSKGWHSRDRQRGREHQHRRTVARDIQPRISGAALEQPAQCGQCEHDPAGVDKQREQRRAALILQKMNRYRQDRRELRGDYRELANDRADFRRTVPVPGATGPARLGTGT